MTLVMAAPVKPGAVQNVWLCMFNSVSIRNAMCRSRESVLGVTGRFSLTKTL